MMMAGSVSVLGIDQEPVDPVDWREIAPFLINIPNWDAEGDAEGASVNMMNFKISNSERDYSDGTRDLTITIVDGGFVPMVYASFTMLKGFEVDTSEEYIKSTTIQGYPGMKQYTYATKEGSVMALLDGRFLVTLYGENFENISDLEDIFQFLDLNGIAALGN